MRWAATFTPEMSTGLLTAIAMDTGWFRHPNTRPETLRTAAELIESGARIEEIYRLLFERNTLGRLKMLGETLASLQTDLDGRIAYATVTRDDFERTGAIPQDTEDLVDYTVSVDGRRRRPPVHRAGPGRDQAERPVAERPRLLAGSPASSAAAATRPPPARPCPTRSPNRCPGSSTPSARRSAADPFRTWIDLQIGEIRGS